jgi:hypothetical protein
LSIAYNRITDDFEKIETSTATNLIGSKFILRPLDYILLILGARDYSYIMDSSHMLDNEVTSLYPIASYHMLQFILFMLSFKNAYIRHLFNFRKDKKTGVASEIFFKCISWVYSKYQIPKSTDFSTTVIYTRRNRGFRFYHTENTINMVYNFSSRPFAFLVMPFKFLLNPRSNIKRKKKGGDPIYIELFCNKTSMLTWPLYAPKLKLSNLSDIEFAFKNDVLEYLPRFYYNRYDQYHHILIKKGTAGRTGSGGGNSAFNKFGNELTREEQTNFMTRTDLNKKNIGIEISEELADGYILQRKMLDKKLGLVSKTDEEIAQELFYKLKEEKFERIEKVDELDEFYLKSIIIRRPPTAKINTMLNGTNGVYLLHNGVARFKELLSMEILHHKEKINNDIIKVTQRSIEIRYKKEEGGKTIYIPFSKVVDMNNKPYLLSNKFMRLVDAVYGGKYELHGLLKYAEIYSRLFNHFGNKIIWFILGTEFKNYTGFNFEKYLDRKKQKQNNSLRPTFVNFEALLERPKKMDFIFKRLKYSNMYSRQREILVRKKFLLPPPAKHY